MSKDLNVNKRKNVNTKVPHNQSVSTCSDRAIISGHADHYLTAFWCLESNLREARPWLWLTIEEGKHRSKRAFSFTSPQNVNSPTACRPAGAFESSCPRSLWKWTQRRSSCTSQSPGPIAFSLSQACRYGEHISSPLQYTVQCSWQRINFPIVPSLSALLWRQNGKTIMAKQTGNEHDKVSDIWEPNTLWNDVL